MIRFSAIVAVVVVALGLLIAGAVSGTLMLVYLAIAVAGLALVLLITGVLVWRDEIFGKPTAAQAAVGQQEVGVRSEQDIPVGARAGGRAARPAVAAASGYEGSGQATGFAPVPGQGPRPAPVPAGQRGPQESPARDRVLHEDRSARDERERRDRQDSGRGGLGIQRPGRDYPVGEPAAAVDSAGAGASVITPREASRHWLPNDGAKVTAASADPARTGPPTSREPSARPPAEPGARPPAQSGTRPPAEPGATAPGAAAPGAAASVGSVRPSAASPRPQLNPLQSSSPLFPPADSRSAAGGPPKGSPPADRPADLFTPRRPPASAPQADAPAASGSPAGGAGSALSRPVASERTGPPGSTGASAVAGRAAGTGPTASSGPAAAAAAAGAGSAGSTGASAAPAARAASAAGSSFSSAAGSAKVTGSSDVIPTTDRPAAGDPPAGDPPAGDPPGGDPPAGDPSAGESAATDRPAAGERPAGAPPAPRVTVVPGIARYHMPDCILIRFLGAEDLQTMALGEAEQTGCVPCRACRPEKELATR